MNDFLGFTRPFTLDFHSDASEENSPANSVVDSGNRGFCLDYVQMACRNVVNIG